MIKISLRPDNIIKYNTYTIHLDNKENFFRKKYFLLIPGKECPNKSLKTFFFKPEYPTISYEYSKFQEKNFTLKISGKEDNTPTVFINDMTEIRQKLLNKSGFDLDTKMGFHNLYMMPYVINHTLKEKLNNYIINRYQKINRFFNFQEYVSKSLLYINYKKLEKKFPMEYNYMFETYSFPEEKKIIEKKFKNYISEKEDDMWMIKPKLGSIGGQISLLSNFTNIKLNQYIITKYLKNPHLIRGYKYDIRFHGLISTIKPLKLYLYNEGFVRIASEKFSILNTQNKYVFLTNLLLNQKNKNKYIYPQNFPNMEGSNLWNLEYFQKYCDRNNINYNKKFSEVGDIFIKAIISVREKLLKYIEKTNLEYSNFYHLIGFDIIFDENLKPYLLEMNRRCGFRDDNDAEKYYTFNIITDTLNIIGIRPKNILIENDPKEKRNSLMDHLEESFCELERPRGGYKLIFPLKKNIEKYKKFFGENIPEEDIELWKKLKD